MYKVKVPGSVMLFGEHAVLYGEKAIVTAIDRYLTIGLDLRSNNQMIINSPSFASWRGDINELSAIPDKLNYVREALLIYHDQLTSGFEITIDATNFPSNVGLGSSAAVTVGIMALLRKAFSRFVEKNEARDERFLIFNDALRAVHRISPKASGSDLLASVYGGILLYRPSVDSGDHLEMERIKTRVPLPMFLYYVGYKTPTAQVIERVQDFFVDKPLILNAIVKAMGLVVEQAKEELRSGDWQSLGELALIHQGLQDSLGTCDANLSKLVYKLREQKGVWGAKISGSGLGDCVLGLGEMRGGQDALPDDALIEVAVDDQGLRFV